MKWSQYWLAPPPKDAIPDDDIAEFLDFAKRKYCRICDLSASFEVNGHKCVRSKVEDMTELYVAYCAEILMLYREWMAEKRLKGDGT